MMSKSILQCLVFIIVPLLASSFVASFAGSIRETSATKLYNSKNEQSYDIEAASVKFSWETARESNSKPLLDLSARDLSPEDSAGDKVDTSKWDKGQIWKRTQQSLSELGIEESDEFLSKCPQLLRMETEMVAETAEWLIQEFGNNYAQTEPRLLCFPVSDVSYGLELMSTMMMTNAKPVCAAAPAFLLNGIEEGLRERAVKDALASASDATSKATKSIAGDTMSTLKQLQNRKFGGLGGSQ